MAQAVQRSFLTALALIAAGGVITVSGASAATPASVSISPGGAAKTYTGSPVTGNADPLGPPAPVCAPSQCDQETVHLSAPASYTKTHTITLTATVTFDDGGSGNTLDVAILDHTGSAIATSFAVRSGGSAIATGVKPGTYVVEVDGDIAATSQTYKGSVQATGATAYVPPKRSSGGLSFGRNTLTDPYRLGTEPNIAIGPDDKTVYESPIFGFSTTQSFLTRSDNAGRTFNVLGLPGIGKLDECTGGGDSDLATDKFPGDIYMIDLGGAPEVPARVSNNKGLSFASKCEANQEPVPHNYFTDRQWLSTDYKHHVEWYIYRDGVLSPPSTTTVGGLDLSKQGYGEYLKYAPLASGPGKANAAQISFSSVCTAAGTPKPQPCLSDILIAGNATTDNAKNSPHYGTTFLAEQTSKGVGVASFSTSGPASVKQHTAVPGVTQILFPTTAVDRAGTVYLAYTDEATARSYLTHTIGGNLDKWTKPVVINGGGVYTTVMPWIVAGDEGRIDVVFYGTHNPKPPTSNYGPWYPYLAQSLNATKAKPHFTQAKMTARPNHIDPICLSGLGCTTSTGPDGDRELGDFFKVTLDSSGRALVSFADGDNQLGNEAIGGPEAAPSFANFVRQSTGPSLYRKVGRLHAIKRPTNCASLGSHHNPVPFSLGTGSKGADVTALQLRKSCLSRTSGGALKATLSLASLNPTAATSPPALDTATYLVRWVYKNKVFFAAAETTAGSPWSYFTGQAAPVSDALAVKYAYYPATTSIKGSVSKKSKTITLHIPASDVGSPPFGTRLTGVTAYAITHAVPTLPLPPSVANFTDLPQVADVLPAYDAILRSAHAAGGGSSTTGTGGGTSNGSGHSNQGSVATGGLADTGGPRWQPILGLCLMGAGIALATLTRRRTRRA